MGVSKNRGTPKSSVLIGCSIRNHPFWGTLIFGNTHIFLALRYPGVNMTLIQRLALGPSQRFGTQYLFGRNKFVESLFRVFPGIL